MSCRVWRAVGPRALIDEWRASRWDAGSNPWAESHRDDYHPPRSRRTLSASFWGGLAMFSALSRVKYKLALSVHERTFLAKRCCCCRALILMWSVCGQWRGFWVNCMIHIYILHGSIMNSFIEPPCSVIVASRSYRAISVSLIPFHNMFKVHYSHLSYRFFHFSIFVEIITFVSVSITRAWDNSIH